MKSAFKFVAVDIPRFLKACVVHCSFRRGGILKQR